MKITKIHLAQTIIKVTISMAALVGFAVTSTQQASADSSSPFIMESSQITHLLSSRDHSYNSRYTLQMRMSQQLRTTALMPRTTMEPQ